ncbi:MAG: MlaE family lipid ABC transporter permease subunit [Gammaproteobacteria bacterium]
MTSAQIKLDDNTLYCSGTWTTLQLQQVETQLQQIDISSHNQLAINGDQITQLDSSGAWLLHHYYSQWQASGKTIQLENFKPPQQQLIELIQQHSDNQAAPQVTSTHNIFYYVGRGACAKYDQAREFFSFIGELTLNVISLLRTPRRFRLPAITQVIELTGIHALGIIGLLSFLIGIVLAYQVGLQLQLYGANIFIVELSGMSVLREFGPLITAVILAGRTSSAFTAEIGMMRVNQELDALTTMGLTPHEYIILPKIIGLFLVFPLLIVWADVFGVLGGMIMAQGMLGINFLQFLIRFHNKIQPLTFFVGLIKAPVFAMIISTVGCFQGLKVQHQAESVGKQTTKSVVQAIFLIVVADATFSIIFSWLGI